MEMQTPFVPGPEQPSDEALIELAKEGSAAALEELVERHQKWIYNLALRMVHSLDDAADVTQEVLLKVVTRLSTFEHRSAFRTWLYRIVTNHVINMKTRPVEKMVTTFSNYGKELDAVPDLDPPDERSAPVDVELIVKEAKIGCMAGMLLCLDRTQRVVYVLGELFGVTDVVGAEITGLTRDNFRQKLARARRDLYQFMNDKCGLVKKDNPCRCARKTRGFIQAGMVDPERLVFADGHLRMIREVSPGRSEDLDRVEAEYAALFRNHAFADGPKVAETTRELIERGDLRAVLDLA